MAITTQTWVVLLIGWKFASTNQNHFPDHQYGISALVSQTLFCGETSGGLAKCRLYFSGSVTRDPSNMRVTWDFTVSLLWRVFGCWQPLRLENFLRVMNKLVIAQYFKSGKINSLLVWVGMRSKLMIPRCERLTDKQTALAPVNQKVDNAMHWIIIPIQSGCKESRFYRLPFRQVVASMH